MKRIVLLLIILTTQKQLNAQVAISYFPFQSILSISTNTEKRLFADFKVETNNFISNLNIELSPKVNFKRLEYANYYTGIGISINPTNSYSDLPITNGYFIDFGIRAIPIKTLSNFQVVFEISPYINKDFDGGTIRTRLGFAWNFKNKSKSKAAHE
jgi:hypothetical protein